MLTLQCISAPPPVHPHACAVRSLPLHGGSLPQGCAGKAVPVLVLGQCGHMEVSVDGDS